MLKAYLGADTSPVYCTKIASRLARTYTDRHGLKDLVREMVGIMKHARTDSDIFTFGQQAYKAGMKTL